MSAKRYSGQYTINLQWQPLRSFDVGADWTLGHYRVTIRRPGTRHNLEEHILFVWKEPSRAGYGTTPQELGVGAGDLGKPRAYDAAAHFAIDELHQRWPNRTLFQEILTHGIKRSH